MSKRARRCGFDRFSDGPTTSGALIGVAALFGFGLTRVHRQLLLQSGTNLINYVLSIEDKVKATSA
jgi:hypothetical protein